MFNKWEYQRRRKELMQQMGKDSIAILSSASLCQRNRDVDYPFRQNSDFFYLTGFPEPNAIAVLIPEREHGEYLLFCQEKDKSKEIWNGRIIGQEDACEVYGAEDAFPIDDIEEIIMGLIEGKKKVLYPIGTYPEFDQTLMEWINKLRSKLRSGINPPMQFLSLDCYLHEMRLFKTPLELEQMRQAAKISIQAHQHAMRFCQAEQFEYQIEAEIIHQCMSKGAVQMAYPSIVGGGENACILHYTENNAKLKDGDLLLIDAGCECNNYASDITRTFPVNGVFNPQQKDLYEIVLAAQKAAIAMIKPGMTWNQPHEIAVETITQGLMDLGLLKGKKQQLIKDKRYQAFYMHRTGHWLGLDVHDVGNYKIDGQWREFEEGMTLTVEPGIYTGTNPEINKSWWNIGIRIEDNVLVTAKGCEVLTQAMPKEVNEIENLCQQ